MRNKLGADLQKPDIPTHPPLTSSVVPKNVPTSSNVANPVVWMFAGQGAQYFRMGEALYVHNRVFRDVMDKLDRVVTARTGVSIVAVLYGDAQKIGTPFDNLSQTHPALFIVQFALAQTLLEQGAAPPDVLFGSSLGEFVAAAVAGVAPAEEMVLDLLKQAWVFDNLADAGAMMMVLDDVDRFYDDPVLSTQSELAGVSFSRCFVIAGTTQALDRISVHLRAQNVSYQQLPVGYAFHSSGIDPMEGAYRAALGTRDWQNGTIPVIGASDGTGDPIKFEGRDWWQVVRGPIHFLQSLRAFDAKHPGAVYIDLGPAGNMKTACHYCLSDRGAERSYAIMTPFGNELENLARLAVSFEAKGKWRERKSE